MKHLMTLIALALSSQAHADIYKCQVGGRYIYQADPCATGASSSKVQVHSRKIAPQNTNLGGEGYPATEVKRPASQSERDLALANNLERERLGRDLDREIAHAENRISELRQRMSDELEVLRNKKSQSKNNLAGAVWEQSISEEMTATSNRYTADIAAEQNGLEQLRTKREKLKK